jgi:hypothetical protein
MEVNHLQQIISEWTGNEPLEKQIVILAEKVRDIPYGNIGSRDPLDVLNNNQGTCSGKHELLKLFYRELNIPIRDMIAWHRFKDMKVAYPENVLELLNNNDIIDPHNYFQIYVNEKWIDVDITWDKPLKGLGFIVNEGWDGKTGMELCVVPYEILQVEDPIQFKKENVDKLPEEVKNNRKKFLELMTEWLVSLRSVK